MMDFEDVKVLARAGFTAEEIRAMQLPPKSDTVSPKVEQVKTEEIKPVPMSETKTAEITEEKNADIVKELTTKIEALTKAVQAGNRLAIDNNAPKTETVDDILKTLIK